jgi:DNA-directed RNA polymerase subunit RPC12/RpoP
MKWYELNHGQFEDYYLNNLTKENIESSSKDEFIEFFYRFAYDGGKIQSGGQRTANEFKNTTLENKYSEFKEYVLEPFSDTFDVEKWLFTKRKRFKGWGMGIASIYLNRVNKNNFSIINEKTINSLLFLEFNITKTIDSWNNYSEIHKIQTNLINEYPILKNYFMVDAINEFIIGEPKYENTLKELKESQLIDNENIKTEIVNVSKDELKALIENDNDKEREYVTKRGKTYKRDQYKMELIKKYRGYKCQFCNHTILTKNNDYYVEACHIIPVSQNGEDVLRNVIILCPNCHKLFDVGNRIEIEWTDSIYKVELNGNIYEAKLI